MRNFEFHERCKKILTPEIVMQLTRIYEFKGEQTLFIEAHKDELSELMEIAKIQSTESSNKIEGIYTSDERLKKIVLEKTMPKTRNEFEIAGYRDVLNTIHESYEHIPVRPSIILQLHRDLYKFMGTDSGGFFKTADNIIEEMSSDGERKVRFTPIPAWETSEAMDKLCESYNKAFQDDYVDKLILLPMFIFDFLCIHPFNDGNGRMSRLLTILLLYQSGFIVGKYISIEKMIEISKDTYYEALQESSIGWHEGENNYIPFVSYMLGVIVNAYKEFSSRVKLLSLNGKKTDRVREIIKTKVGTITKSEIIDMCPDISVTTIQRALAELLEKGEIIKISGGRYTKYTWNWEDK